MTIAFPAMFDSVAVLGLVKSVVADGLRRGSVGNAELPSGDSSAVLFSLLSQLTTKYPNEPPASFGWANDFLWATPSDAAVGSAMREGLYEPFEVSHVVSKVEPGFVCVDVGANVGQYALPLARAVGPDGVVLCLEPDGYACDLLRINARINGLLNILVAQTAVGDANGTSRFYRSRNNAGDHRMHPDKEVEYVGDVGTITIDSLSMERIDLLKVDVQGHEASVIHGAMRTLLANPRCRLAIEFWPEGLTKAGSSTEALASLVFDELQCECYIYIPRYADGNNGVDFGAGYSLVPVDKRYVVETEQWNKLGFFFNLWCERGRQ